MSSCLDCGLAQWKMTSSGRKHPDGSGKCGWNGWEEFRLPHAFKDYHNYDKDRVGYMRRPDGGYIDRKSPHKNCPFYQKPITSKESK